MATPTRADSGQTEWDMAKRRPTTREKGLSGAWTHVRLAVLARDHYRCQLCGGKATAVDHIRPRSRGGSLLDPRNLRAICRSCNSRRNAELATQGWLQRHPLPYRPRRVWPGAIGGGAADR